ncbi:hypothetical protein KSF_005650 [Reticulibacter mediterranei]|uniref:Uncharacterized protein n=1 Tax=Reticulibacter mediterranei TaxID=2778369 RepID=A0A8J3MY46_9CHLR|nr:hypothetical protein KSF_005650 [Reticulibacter mediterranei]
MKELSTFPNRAVGPRKVKWMIDSQYDLLFLVPIDAGLLALGEQIEIDPPAVSTAGKKIEWCLFVRRYASDTVGMTLFPD